MADESPFSVGVGEGEERKSQSSSLKKNFKKGLDPKELKKKRLESNFRLRKQKRDQLLSATRIKIGASELLDRQFDREEVREMIKNAKKAETAEELKQCLQILRKSLSSTDPPIEYGYQEGLPLFLLEIVHRLSSSPSSSSSSDDHLETLLEAVWCCTNLAAGDPSLVGVLIPIAPLLVAFLSGNHPQLIEHSLLCLGNMASGSVELRDKVRGTGVIQKAIGFLQNQNVCVVESAAFLLCSLVRGEKPRVGELVDAGVIPPLVSALLQATEVSLLVELAWLLSYISAIPKFVPLFLWKGKKEGETDSEMLDDGGEMKGKRGEMTGIVERIVLLLREFCEKCEAAPLLVPLIRVTSNIVCSCSGPEDLTGLFLSFPTFFPSIKQLLHHGENRAIKKECAWLVSNITASPYVIHCIENDMIPVLVHLLLHFGFEIRREAAYGLMNMTLGCPEKAVPLILECGGLRGFLDLLSSLDGEIVELSLSFVTMVLRGHSEGVALVEREGGIDALESVSSTAFPALYQVANGLVDEFYSDIPEDEGGFSSSSQQQQDDFYPPWRQGGR